MRIIGEWDLPGHSGPVYALACDSKAKKLFSGGADGLVAAWSCISGKHAQAVAKTPNAIYALHWIASLRHLYVGESSGTVYVLDLAASQLRRAVKAHTSSVFGLYSHPTDPEGWSSGRDGRFLYWNTGESIPYADILVSEAGLRTFILTPDGEHFLCAGRDGILYEIHRKQQRIIRQIPAHKDVIFQVFFSPQGTLLATGDKAGVLKLWTPNLELLWEHKAHEWGLNALAWHRSGMILATGGRDHFIHLWDIQKRRKILSLSGHKRSVNALVWINEESLASASDDGLIRIWHLEV
ncbi:MAG: hypothetical protein NZ580_07100 [Bacteroidia bacterium]|nr:hypothetical protein [Bacteroidia bacterium]